MYSRGIGNSQLNTKNRGKWKLINAYILKVQAKIKNFITITLDKLFTGLAQRSLM